MNRQPISVSIAATATPTFASDTPAPHHLQISDISKIPEILRELETDAERAKLITDVIICEAEVEESDEEVEGATSSQETLPQSDKESNEVADAEAETEAEIVDTKNEEACTEVVKLLTAVQNSSTLQRFQWTGPDAWSGQRREGKRSTLFWEALWNSAPTLHALNLQFFDHELDKIHDSQDEMPLCPSFPRLEGAFFDASRAHGDDGSFLDQWIRQCPALQLLDLQLPPCDLESCRIQRMTWDYHLPALTQFGLRGYGSDSDGLAAFLHRNTAIKTLNLDVSTDDPINFPPNTLPNLMSLSIDLHGRSALVSSISSGLANTSLRHLRIHGCPHQSYSEIANVAGSLRCLELDLGSGWRNRYTDANDTEPASEDGAAALPNLPRIIKKLLPLLPRLQELALDLETANTTIFEGSGEECKEREPDAMGESDLKIALQLLPSDTQIRALRLSDSRGLPLPAKLLDGFPEKPPSLEYIKWENGTKSVLYQLKRDGMRVRAVECEPLRETSGNGFWTEKRVLDFEDNS